MTTLSYIHTLALGCHLDFGRIPLPARRAIISDADALPCNGVGDMPVIAQDDSAIRHPHFSFIPFSDDAATSLCMLYCISVFSVFRSYDRHMRAHSSVGLVWPWECPRLSIRGPLLWWLFCILYQWLVLGISRAASRCFNNHGLRVLDHIIKKSCWDRPVLII